MPSERDEARGDDRIYFLLIIVAIIALMAVDHFATGPSETLFFALGSGATMVISYVFPHYLRWRLRWLLASMAITMIGLIAIRLFIL